MYVKKGQGRRCRVLSGLGHGDLRGIELQVWCRAVLGFRGLGV